MGRGACKDCQGPIRWGKDGARFVPLNIDGTPHYQTCPKRSAPKCRQCELPIVWKEHEGKRQCFEPDGTTPHNDVCTRYNECSHCGQKVKWAIIDNKWLAFDNTITRELHWDVCPRNAPAAKALVQKVVALEAEKEAHWRRCPENVDLVSQNARLQKRIKDLEGALKALEGEARMHQVELKRLTKKVTDVERAS
jgi:hypothetical protein